MKPYRVIAFYTDDEIYGEAIKKLTSSLIRFDIPHTIKAIPKKETWKKTLLSMHPLTLEAFDLYPNENLLYLDADAVVQQYPILFDTIDCDIAVHYRDGKELLVGTTYLKNCEKVKELVRQWAKYSLLGDDLLSPQTGLVEALKHGDYNIYNLPASYTLIFDGVKSQGPPVIEHFQYSRKVRDKR